MRKKTKISILDVAEAAGVSRSTVSRVINNDPRAAADTVERVQQTIRDLGYTPPPIEKRVRRPSRKWQGIHRGYVALFFPDVNPDAEHTYLSSQLIRGASMALTRHHLELLVTHMPAPHTAPEAITRHKVDGILIRSGQIPDSVLRKVKKIPSVLLFEQQNRLLWSDLVASDNQAAGELAAQWLDRQEKRQVVLFSPEVDHFEFSQRTRSCLRILEGLGHEVHLIQEVDPSEGTLAKALQRHGADAAVFLCGQDASVMKALLEVKKAESAQRIQIPVIATANNRDLLRSIAPSATFIDLQTEHLADVAVETLLWRMKNPREPTRTISITPALIE